MDAKLFRNIYEELTNPTWCKSIEQEVFFNSKGFHHLLYDGAGKKRSRKQQYERLGLIPFIPEILEIAASITYRKVPSGDIEYWGLSAAIPKLGNRKVRMVLKRVGDGKIIFWSLILLT